jgi:uncharacterized protein (DUF4415 family)
LSKFRQNNFRMKKTSRKKAAKKEASKKVSSIRASASSGKDWEIENFYRPIKRPVTLRLDADVIAWFKTQGRGYQTRINKALRQLMLQDRKSR